MKVENRSQLLNSMRTQSEDKKSDQNFTLNVIFFCQSDPSNNLVPTIGFSSHDLKNSHRYAVRLYDVGGGKNIRDIWRNYFPLVHGFVLLIDSTDETRLDYVREVLQDALANDCVRGKPILV